MENTLENYKIWIESWIKLLHIQTNLTNELLDMLPRLATSKEGQNYPAQVKKIALEVGKVLGEQINSIRSIAKFLPKEKRKVLLNEVDRIIKDLDKLT